MLSVFLTLLLASNLWATESSSGSPSESPSKDPPASTAGAAKKSAPMNTSLFESDNEEEPAAESKTKSLSAKVKVVREDSDGVEVFFEGDQHRGAYYLLRSLKGYATHLKALEDSKKPQGPAVSVSFDAERRIKSVEKKKSQELDPNKQWDFNKPASD